MKFFRYIVLSLLFLTVLNVSSQEQYIKILDFRVDETIDPTTLHTLAQDFAYVNPDGAKECWALLIIESNINGDNIKISTGRAGDYVEKLKCDVSHWYENDKFRKPSQEEKDNLRARMEKVKAPTEKWISIKPNKIATRIKVTTLGESPKGLNPNGEAVVKNSKGEIIGSIEQQFFISAGSIARKFEAGKVYRLTIEVPQDYKGAVSEPAVVTPGFVTFTTDPVGATVTIMRNGKIESTGVATPDFTGILPYGTYSYTVSEPNYHSEEGTLVIGAEPQSKSIKLRPAFGSLVINSTPQGASVMIDGMTQSGVTPLTIPQLPSGSHTITLNKADYSQATRTVTITDGQQTVENIALDARFAMVTINSLPGASIYVDNRLVGTGNYSGNLNSGIHILKATLKSHKDANQNISVEAKVPQTIELKPTPICGTLTAISSPTGADIIIDGVKRGVTPMNITDLLVGDYDVVISKAGYASHSQHIIVEEKTPVIINPTLQSGRSVTITTGTAGDAIYVDGSYVGTSPATTELAFGSHTLRATRNDKGKQIETSETVTVGQGTTPLTFTLRLKSGALMPRWSSSATAEQKRILGELIESMVMVEGGTFTMGATSEQGSDASDSEKPTHRVTLSDYYIGKYEVTQEQWQAVMGSNPSYFKGRRKPVEEVSWNDCQEFIKKLNRLTGLNFVLPTETQWEYAARGGNKSRGYKYSGGNDLYSVGWFGHLNTYGDNKGNSGSETHSVGLTAPNELGLYDMSGNVYEWCQDWYGSYSSSSQTDPTGPSTGSSRVNRGGGWFDLAGSCRVSIRNSGAPVYSDNGHGLRLAINIDENSDVKHDEDVSIPGGLMPRWSSSATAEQKRILGELIESMVMVEGGTFTMGATSEQGSDAESDEKPTHWVTLSDYYIGKYEVTQEQWQAVMGSNPSNYKGSRKPVETVSWNECQEFIKKLNRLTGLNFSLPTEAQWEYAARGGNKSRGYKCSGSNDIESVARYGSSGGAKDVGQKRANELGLYDMSGNVYEWCQDWYGSYSSSSQTDPTGPSTGSYRVFRGGGWYDFGASCCRVSNRYLDAPDISYNCLGLRLAINIDENSDVKHDEVVSIPGGLMPRWSSSATAEQKRIIGELIESMVMVEGGTFTMGAQGWEFKYNEMPEHSVTLSDYYIGKYEVTQEQWQTVMNKNPNEDDFFNKGNKYPVSNISWKECQKFVRKLQDLTGLKFVLPTEAQWEYAARGGNKSLNYKYAGSNDLFSVGWFEHLNTYGDNKGNSSSEIHPVGQKQANELGLYDMSGNVWEWCQDRYGSYSSSSQTDPAGPSTGSNRVKRGGCTSSCAEDCRVSSRYGDDPGDRFCNRGLRLALQF